VNVLAACKVQSMHLTTPGVCATAVTADFMQNVQVLLKRWSETKNHISLKPNLLCRPKFEIKVWSQAKLDLVNRVSDLGQSDFIFSERQSDPLQLDTFL